MFSFAKKIKDRLEGAGLKDETDSYFASNLSINNGGYGLRVLYVAPGSIAQERGLEAWFDFIVGINGHHLPMKYPGGSSTSGSYNAGDDGIIKPNNPADFSENHEASVVDFDLLAQGLNMAATSPERQVLVHVWNAKGGTMRQISLPLNPPTKSTAETANTSVYRIFENQFAELGLTVVSQHLTTATHVWRILNTHAHSPAFQAQVVPYSDYIVGCDSVFPSNNGEINGKSEKGLLAGGGESLLPRTLASYYAQYYETSKDGKVPIILYVYNHDLDVLRPVTVNLSRHWNPPQDKGLLGCDVGYGLLHRIPKVPGNHEEKFEKSVFGSISENSQYVPQPQASFPPAAPVPKSPAKGKLSDRYAPKSVIDDKMQADSEIPGPPKEPSSPENPSNLETSANEIDGGENVFNKVSESPSDQPVLFEEKTGEPEILDAVKNEEKLIEPANSDPTSNEPTSDSSKAIQESNSSDYQNSETANTVPISALTAKFEQSLDLDDDLLEDPSDEESNFNEKEPILSELSVEDGTIDEAVNVTNEAAPEEHIKIEESEEKESGNNEIVKEETKDKEVAENESEEVISEDHIADIQVPPTAKSDLGSSEITKTIDLMLDEDEDFLDHNEEPNVTETSELIESTENHPSGPITRIENVQELTEIPLSEPVVHRTDTNTQTNPPLAPLPNPQNQFFSPMAANPLPNNGLSPQAPKPGRRRKAHAAANLESLADFMDEELSKSKANDTSYGNTKTDEELNGIPPPPPKSVKH